MRHLIKYMASLVLMLMAVLPMQAQTENQAFYIYQNDGHFDGFFYDEIEKMTFSFLDTLGVEHDEIVSQEIVTADSTYRIMLSAIDSIGFVQPELKYNPQVHIKGQSFFYGDFQDLMYTDYGEEGGLIYFGKWLEERANEFYYDEEKGEYIKHPLPQVGDVFVDFDPEYGWSAKIERVYHDEDGILIAACKPIDDITDIFQQFITVEEYGYDDAGNLARRRVAGCPELTIGNFPKRSTNRASGQWEGDLFNFSLNTHVPIYYSDDLTISVDPSIDGKLHLKTTWNLSLFGDKYICIQSKLNFGVGIGFTVDGKFADFFPGGVGGLLSGVPVPATCPIIMLDIAPDAFIRGEAHVSFRASTPKLNGAMWTKLEIKNWVPNIDMGFGNSDDGSKFDSVDNSDSRAKISLNGFVQMGMLFPMKFTSLPVIKKLFDSEIGGQWFVGPKLAADFTLDLTTMPWDDTASYTQLKNITGQLHMLDADYEVKGKVKTVFSGKKEVTLADGSISLFPPLDASLVPDFEDVTDDEGKVLIGENIRNCRVISFKPTGYVIKPVDVGVRAFGVKEDGTTDFYDEAYIGAPISYYHLAELLGQELDKSHWAKLEVPYLIGKSTGDLGRKLRAVPYVTIAGHYFYSPKYYDFNTEPMYEASSDVWVIDWDGTIKKPVVLKGYIDSLSHTYLYPNPYDYVQGFHPYSPSYLKFDGKASTGEDKSVFTATIDLKNYVINEFPRNYNPVDTVKYGDILTVHKQVEEGYEYTHRLPFDMKTYVLPCPKDPKLSLVDIKVSSSTEGVSNLSDMNLRAYSPYASITRLEKSKEHPDGGWHVSIDCNERNNKVSASFDIVCEYWMSNYFDIKNGQLSYSGSSTSKDYDIKCSGAGSFSKDVQFNHSWSSAPKGELGKTFSLQFGLQGQSGTYSVKKDGKVTKTTSFTPSFSINIEFEYEE